MISTGVRILFLTSERRIVGISEFVLDARR
jgi:hypothetical protein